MGTQRNGARSFLNALQEACRFSRMPGFRTGIGQIVGEGATLTNLLAGWEVVCIIIDAMVAGDNFFNQRDYVNDDGTGEDTAPPA